MTKKKSNPQIAERHSHGELTCPKAWEIVDSACKVGLDNQKDCDGAEAIERRDPASYTERKAFRRKGFRHRGCVNGGHGVETFSLIQGSRTERPPHQPPLISKCSLSGASNVIEWYKAVSEPSNWRPGNYILSAALPPIAQR